MKQMINLITSLFFVIASLMAANAAEITLRAGHTNASNSIQDQGIQKLRDLLEEKTGGKATIEIHSDAVNKSDNVLVVDDLIATGGTALATIELIKKLGANVTGCTFIIDLPELGGRKKIEDNGIEVQTLCSFEGH